MNPDCLDRTNLGETLISTFALDAYMIKLGLDTLSTNPGSLAKSHREMFSANGDALSVIYTNAGAMDAVFTATGVATKLDVELNALKSAKRMYSQRVAFLIIFDQSHTHSDPAF